MFDFMLGEQSILSDLPLPSWGKDEAMEIYKNICQAIQYSDFDENDIKVVVAGNPITHEVFSYDNNELNNTKIIDLYSRGATIVLHGAERFSNVVREYMLHEFSHIKENCHVNVYLTPSESKGVGYHYDDHDVIVYQVSGAKCWDYKKEDGTENDFNTQQNGWYFIKQGIEHSTRTKEQFSMHLTFGLSSSMKIKLTDKTYEYREGISVIESLNGIAIDTVIEDLQPLTQNISEKIDAYSNNLSLDNQRNTIFEFIRESTYEELCTYLTSNELSQQSKLKFIKILIKSGIAGLVQCVNADLTSDCGSTVAK